MQNSILTAPCVELKDFNTLFIELTAKNCNLKCKHCYIDFTENKKIKDFIPIDKIKQSLIALKNENIEFIHLSGAEPMLHPDFNAILRLCLRRASVVIHTNGMSVNDKKARFLRKVEEENTMGHEIIFKIGINHYDEKQNDELRGRGSYRKSIHATQSLVKYGFNPILSIVNYWNLPISELQDGFKTICQKFGFETESMNFDIIPYINKNEPTKYPDRNVQDLSKIDCAKSRTLTNKGIFNCMMLTCDNRGHCGSSFEDFSRKNYLETEICSQCIKHQEGFFTLKLG